MEPTIELAGSPVVKPAIHYPSPTRSSSIEVGALFRRGHPLITQISAARLGLWRPSVLSLDLGRLCQIKSPP